jgi:hypothetical protein
MRRRLSNSAALVPSEQRAKLCGKTGERTGELKWDGASGCYFVIDRKQDMFFILLEQTPSECQKIQPMVKKLIYEAMEK